MFEQSVITTHRRPWTMAASLTLQCAFAGAIVLVSVISIQRLPLISLPAPLPPMPRAPRSEVRIVASENMGSAGVVVPPTVAARRVFQAPTGIPTKITMIDDGPLAYTGPVSTTGTGIASGVVGAVGDYFATNTERIPDPPKLVQAPKREALPSKPIEVGGKVQEAKLVHRVMPVYPPLARQARISGQVRLVAVIGRDGTVKELQVLGGHPLLVPTAVDAVRQWVYSPTLLNGKPVEVIAPIDVNFTLSGN